MFELIETIPVQNELGEGVIWDSHRQCIWWTDIGKSKLHRYDPTSKTLKVWPTPERLCCFAPVYCAGKNQDCLVAAFESGFAYYHPETERIEWIKKIEPVIQALD